MTPYPEPGKLKAGDGSEAPRVTAATVPVHLREATWLAAPHPWFWQCTECHCGFGPLVTQHHAEDGAREHMTEDHGGMPAGAQIKTMAAILRPDHTPEEN